MSSYFDTVKSFADVPTGDKGVDTLAFLEASEGLSGLFKLLDSAAFTPVQKDIDGNIKKIRTRYDAAPNLSGTLEELVDNEKREKNQNATEGLLWLNRGLSFTGKALRYSQDNKTEELSKAFTVSYEQTLKQYHGVLIRPIFSLAMKACPYRADFYAKLAKSGERGKPPATEEELKEQLRAWLDALDKIVKRVEILMGKKQSS